LACFFIDARAVQSRLDHVVGPMNWQTRLSFLDDGATLCRLSIRFGDRWVGKEEIGGPGDVDPQDTTLWRKASVSDSIKRAGVAWSIGRYLYNLPDCWTGWNEQRRDWVKRPELPSWALPGDGQQREREPGDDGDEPEDGITDETLAKLKALIQRLGKSDQAVRISLKARYQCQSLSELSEPQGKELVKELDRIARAMAPENNGAAEPRKTARGRRGQ
jgi:hypothetical protein